MKGQDTMIFVFRILSFKPAFSLSSFTFIKRLFSSSSLSAIRMVLSAYLRLLVFLLAILIPACASSSPAFCMMYSEYKLKKECDNIQPWHTPFPILNYKSKKREMAVFYPLFHLQIYSAFPLNTCQFLFLKTLTSSIIKLSRMFAILVPIMWYRKSFPSTESSKQGSWNHPKIWSKGTNKELDWKNLEKSLEFIFVPKTVSL